MSEKFEKSCNFYLKLFETLLDMSQELQWTD